MDLDQQGLNPAKKDSASYDFILLNQEETAEALRLGRKEKARILEGIKYREELVKKHEPIVFSPEQMLNYAKSEYLRNEGREMEIDDWNREIILSLAKYFSGVGDLDLSKGIMLVGQTGQGKTSIFNAFSENPKRSFLIMECKYLALQYASGGYNQVETLINPHPPIFGNKFRHDAYGICFDDLGTEDVKKNYGNEANVMKDILEMRYSRKNSLAGLTHVVTNLDAESIETFYGERIKSRMREMFNVIEYDLQAPDRRK